MATEANTQSFWEHLDVLRAAIIKIVAVAVVFGIVVFFFKEQLFGVVLVPKDDGFYYLSAAQPDGCMGRRCNGIIFRSTY